MGQGLHATPMDSPSSYTQTTYINGPLLAALISFIIAQSTKLVSHYIKHDVWDITRLWSSGGMPSSHTAFVLGLNVAVLMRDGIGSSTFAIATVVSAVTAYDATGVRLHSGRQASVLNAIVTQLPPEQTVDHEHAGRLKETLGHTPLEVLMGGILGALVGVIVQGIIGW